MVIGCIATTRFNNETLLQNKKWRENNNWDGCIYGSPSEFVSCDFIKHKQIFVIEMNNDTNKIVGIGIITNKLDSQKRCRIYNNLNYNRYIYFGKRIINISSLNPLQIKIIEILETLLFKGHTHVKRARGITLLPRWIAENKVVDFYAELNDLI